MENKNNLKNKYFHNKYNYLHFPEVNFMYIRERVWCRGPRSCLSLVIDYVEVSAEVGPERCLKGLAEVVVGGTTLRRHKCLVYFTPVCSPPLDVAFC